MSTFTEKVAKMAEAGLLHEFEEHIKARISEAQRILEDGKDIPLYRAQGAKKELSDMLDLPDRIIDQAEMDQQDEQPRNTKASARKS